MADPVETRAAALRFLEAEWSGERWPEVIDERVSAGPRAVFEAWIDALGTKDIDAILATAHPELLITQPPSFPGAAEYRGRQGVIEAFADWPAQWQEFRTEPKRAHEPRPGRLVLHAVHHVRGAGSGLALAIDVWWLWDFRDGMLVRWQMFHEEAQLEAALDP